MFSEAELVKGLIHGGDIYSIKNIVTDFSANINPCGLPEGVKKAIMRNLEKSEHYPDPLCRELRKSISKAEKVEKEDIFCGNGAADIIFRLPLAYKPKTALVLAPTFSEYEIALKNVNCKVDHFHLKESCDFELDAGIIKYIDKNSYDIVFICNPNNPTGNVANKSTMLTILKTCKNKGTLLVVDECFLEFCEEHESLTLKSEIAKFDNLVVLKAFTKIYAMPGLRLGYCICSNKEIINKLYSVGQAWGVSQIAQIAGIAALKETSYLENVILNNTLQRNFLVSELNKLGMRVYNSEANYLLFNIENTSHYHKSDFKEKMLKKGFLVRSCANYKGLDENFFRIAVRSNAENLKLIDALKDIRSLK